MRLRRRQLNSHDRAIFFNSSEVKRPNVAIPCPSFVLWLLVDHKAVNIVNETNRLMYLSVKFRRAVPRDSFRLDMIRFLSRPFQNVDVVVKHIGNTTAEVFHSLKI